VGTAPGGSLVRAHSEEEKEDLVTVRESGNGKLYPVGALIHKEKNQPSKGERKSATKYLPAIG